MFIPVRIGPRDATKTVRLSFVSANYNNNITVIDNAVCFYVCCISVCIYIVYNFGHDVIRVRYHILLMWATKVAP